ncbi:uncharacterized protein LOC131218048 [Magnolia sinica]|uniref:uncharacterized protein LOC131218048 n=1 Tax=Magnolia sinica TaxID=86752 RepID=UPI002659A29E|nr:uncharacterized protein LOC131218048 [Magnolia sinica]
MQGRSIAENIAISQELLKDLNRKVRGGNIVLKLDMEKAYDRLDWYFLKQVLFKFGFCSSWITLVEKCWANAWFSVLVDGEASGFFKSLRGMRGLASLRALKSFLDGYQQGMGQKVNLQKSSFLHSPKLGEARVRAIEAILEIARASRVFMYLGVH